MNDFSGYIEHLVNSYEAAGGKLPTHKKTMAVLLRDSFGCHYCGEVTLSSVADHKVPLSLGGTDDMSNLVCACQPCNASKGATPLSRWRGGIYAESGSCYFSDAGQADRNAAK